MQFSEPTTLARRRQDRSVTTETTVADASFRLVADRQNATVVYRDGHPVGVVTAGDLAGHDGRTPTPDALVGDVMSFECVHIDPGADVDATLRLYRDAAWRSLRHRRPCAPENLDRRARSFRSSPLQREASA